SPVSGELFPLARPISLKNASIEAIRRFAPDAVIGAAVHDTTKGSVAHMKPPSESVRRERETTRARWLVRPKFEAGAPARLQPLAKARAFMHFVDSAVNYQFHGAQGFECLGALVASCDCYEFAYGELEEAVRLFAALAEAP
ncbi:MAG TPA: HprK-related kinase A, partial [Burkholderiales bacterium]|nr:HprK-related kinase A [Burkholderiales bacterium]